MKSFNYKLFYFLIFIFLFYAGNLVNAQVFSRNLKMGDVGEDILKLQQILNQDIDTQVSANGVGSKGFETTYFGFLTFDAVKRFQLKYKEEILTPNDLTDPTGFVGPSTIKKLTELNQQSLGENTINNKTNVAPSTKNTPIVTANSTQNSQTLSQTLQNQAYFSNNVGLTQADIDRQNQEYLKTARNINIQAGFAVVFVSPPIAKQEEEIRVYSTQVAEPFEMYVSGKKVNNLKTDYEKGFHYFKLSDVSVGKNTVWIQKDGLKSNEFEFSVIQKGAVAPKISSVPSNIYINKETTIKGSNFTSDIMVKTSFGNFKPTKQTESEIVFVPTLPVMVESSFQNDGILILSGSNGETDAKVVKFIYEKI